MSATRVVSTNPRKSTRVRQVRKVFVLNPNNNRPEHDSSAYKTYRQCEFCKQSGPLVHFPKVFGSNGKEYGTVCKKCLSKETLKILCLMLLINPIRVMREESNEE